MTVDRLTGRASQVSEREQAQQFMVVVKTCFDTVENILNSHKRHCGIYFTHLQSYMNEHLYPLLDNRIETTPDADVREQYRQVKVQLKQTHPAFKVLSLFCCCCCFGSTSFCQGLYGRAVAGLGAGAGQVRRQLRDEARRGHALH